MPEEKGQDLKLYQVQIKHVDQVHLEESLQGNQMILEQHDDESRRQRLFCEFPLKWIMIYVIAGTHLVGGLLLSFKVRITIQEFSRYKKIT